MGFVARPVPVCGTGCNRTLLLAGPRKRDVVLVAGALLELVLVAVRAVLVALDRIVVCAARADARVAARGPGARAAAVAVVLVRSGTISGKFFVHLARRRAEVALEVRAGADVRAHRLAIGQL